MWSATATISSNSVVNVGVAGNAFLETGGGNVFINALVTGGQAGQVSIYKWSGGTGLLGTEVLDNPNNNFISDINVAGGFLRATSPGALGIATDATAIRMAGGNLELRVDPGSTNFSAHTINETANGTLWAERAVGGDGISQTLVFGGAVINNTVIAGLNFNTNNNITGTFNGNDGYGVTLNPGIDWNLPSHRGQSGQLQHLA